ncbi:energy-coupling factor ABC transporter permease [Dechloromonas denitrificans]|uniref:energy-coupling factor ABC transporter permease n=1 Tax=Dechloromonas denitrificans TaxID=281362 RepID=UPI001CFA5513|nr:energy-coupling factor ABC transporter permease [Dechloromonas denitrificans]UCV06385.1 energy-coupling factor ABC transporter permease [Dechloromonas denitrificans]
MNLPDTLLGEEWYWAAWVVWLLFFARSVWRAPWGRLTDSEQLNLWLGMIVLLTLVWSLKAGVKPGLGFHLLGAMVFTLSCGPHLAFIGLSLVTAGITLNGAGGPLAFAANALLLGGLGVAFSQGFYRFLSPLLPRHFFVYIFVNGFFGSALTIIGVGFSVTLFLAVAGVYEWEYLISEYFPYFFLLAFSEAWLSGMVMTLFVVYRPNWVVTFDDSRYLADK